MMNCMKTKQRSAIVLYSGEIKYEHALICRLHESKCGIKGVHFVEKRAI